MRWSRSGDLGRHKRRHVAVPADAVPQTRSLRSDGAPTSGMPGVSFAGRSPRRRNVQLAAERARRQIAESCCCAPAIAKRPSRSRSAPVPPGAETAYANGVPERTGGEARSSRLRTIARREAIEISVTSD